MTAAGANFETLQTTELKEKEDDDRAENVGKRKREVYTWEPAAMESFGSVDAIEPMSESSGDGREGHKERPKPNLAKIYLRHAFQSPPA